MIPYLDLKTQYQTIKPEIEKAVLRVLQSGQYVLGEEVQAFEEDFAAYCHTRFAVAVNTGTSALHLSLLAAGIGPGDEVITTPLTFVATIAAILYTGARPVLVDVEAKTLNLDADCIVSAITPKTKAILPVHLHGKPARMEAVLQISQKWNLCVIEDAAQAHGAEVGGKRTGSMGLTGCFSFYPSKNLGAYGEGGAITTDDPKIEQKIRMLRDWGMGKKYHHDLRGFNFRMESLQGAILRVKLKHLEKWIEARRILARRYTEKLMDVPLQVPEIPEEVRHVYHAYAVMVENRDELREYLASNGIQTSIHYPIPVHLQKAYADLGYKAGDLPNAEAACQKLLSLPLYPEMTTAQVDEVVETLKVGLKTISGGRPL